MIVTFTGDISITGSFLEKVKSNTEIFSSEIKFELINSSFVVGNLEGPTTTFKKAINNNTPLKSPTNTINYLAKRNISIYNLANNHILDYDEEGLRDTLLEIKNENCAYFGAELTKEKTITPVIINKDNISIALFGIAKCSPTKIGSAQLFSSDDFLSLKKQIDVYKKKVDFIIINFHGGEEYTKFPSPVKRKFLKKIANLKDVDCVIAHHSHTLQGYELHKDTYIFYSLGNFIFDIPNHKIYENTDKSALLKLNFSKNKFSFNYIHYQIKNGKIIALNLDIFKTEINKLSDFNGYQKKWQSEAYRVLFRKENSKVKNDKEKKSLQNKSFINLFFTKEFYIKIFTLLKDKYQFSLYINAIIHKFKNKFN
jgi:poly-gamma-glutamate synthesis protein (capsule biosynthesis protein)